MTKAKACEPCVAARMRWLDAPMPTGPLSIAYGSGAAYDSTATAVAERRRARADAWYRLVREQMAGILANCRAGRHEVWRLDEDAA